MGNNGLVQKAGIATEIGPEPTNGAEHVVSASAPYRARVTIVGVADFLFHRWNCEAVEAKANAAKGSAAKKSDDVESYVYRNDDKHLCIPGEYLRQAVIAAAKYRQDPRSPRKSAMDLFKAGIVCFTNLAPIGPQRTNKWDYEDRRRAVVQRSAITRTRPAMKSGWEIAVDLTILLPEYIDQVALLETANTAGRLIGLGDFRPTFGRFAVKHFEILTD